MKHRCELRFRLHRAFTYALLACIPLCVSWAFLVNFVICILLTNYGLLFCNVICMMVNSMLIFTLDLIYRLHRLCFCTYMCSVYAVFNFVLFQLFPFIVVFSELEDIFVQVKFVISVDLCLQYLQCC